ncbi:Cof-type HAD-IIB family hydrolase [uncultured Oscillibacter sp.]|uniref:Cof-type HAD-IIB family hydrolase n=1 Tax=uncultured Oscillibacter sp. TaxID=876091 RepID=UPI00272D915D|nr:HAD family hydrolase [uncultured Oscillibacter sp.]
MDRKLIFLDIDGTLVAALSAPSPKVRQAIRQVRSKGHLAFLCTGRNLPIIGWDILDIGFDGIIASAGAYVSVGDQVLFDSLLPEEVVQECLSVFHSEGVFCRIETPDGIYTDPQMEELLRSVSPDPQNSELIRMQKEIESGLRIRKYEEYPKQGAYKLCFTSRDLDSVRKAREVLGDRFDFVVHPYGASTACFNGEIIPKSVDKGRGIELVCRRFGATPADAVAFGDSMNDAAMLERAGVSVAMGNACDELKALADVVCEDVAHDGVYLELHRMGLCG